MRAINGAITTRTRLPASTHSSVLNSLMISGPSSPPITVAITIGKMTRLPIPMLIYFVPIESTRIAIAMDTRKIFQ